MIDRLISALTDDCRDCAETRRKGKGKVHCPLHTDEHPSLDVQEKDGKVLVFCHSCRDNNGIVAELRARGLDLANGERGLWKSAELPPANGGSAVQKREVARYEYQKADGSPAYTIVRYEPKDFRALGSVPEETRVLYHLPEVLAGVARKERVYIVEGERDVESLRAIGCVATCNPFGAGKFLPRFAEPLIGADVVIIADKDEAGRAHARQVAQSLSLAARSVKILELPDVA